jgi:hypothetical protein
LRSTPLKIVRPGLPLANVKAGSSVTEPTAKESATTNELLTYFDIFVNTLIIINFSDRTQAFKTLFSFTLAKRNHL